MLSFLPPLLFVVYHELLPVSSSQKNNEMYLFFFYVITVQASSYTFGIASGYERIAELQQYQNTNLLTRISLSKELSIIGSERSRTIYFGIEVASRTGFYGPLNISDTIQDDIGGPTPVIYSTPRLELLATARKYIGTSKIFMLWRLGIDFSILKFDRCDLASSNITNLLEYIGFGLELNKKTWLNIAISTSKPISQLQFPSYSIANPCTQTAVLIGFNYKL